MSKEIVKVEEIEKNIKTVVVHHDENTLFVKKTSGDEDNQYFIAIDDIKSLGLSWGLNVSKENMTLIAWHSIGFLTWSFLTVFLTTIMTIFMVSNDALGADAITLGRMAAAFLLNGILAAGVIVQGHTGSPTNVTGYFKKAKLCADGAPHQDAAKALQEKPESFVKMSKTAGEKVEYILSLDSINPSFFFPLLRRKIELDESNEIFEAWVDDVIMILEIQQDFPISYIPLMNEHLRLALIELQAKNLEKLQIESKISDEGKVILQNYAEKDSESTMNDAINFINNS